MLDAITIRQSTAADARRIRRLAELDSAEAPDGDVLLAEIDGQLVAAIDDEGHALADPFVPSADVVEVLHRVVRRPRRWRSRLRLA